MKRLLLFIITILTSQLISAQEKPKNWATYVDMNNQEERLIEYKDSEKALMLKLQQP